MVQTEIAAPPVVAVPRYASLFIEGLREANVSLVTFLPMRRASASYVCRTRRRCRASSPGRTWAESAA
jgi:hypothetical protein